MAEAIASLKEKAKTMSFKTAEVFICFNYIVIYDLNGRNRIYK